MTDVLCCRCHTKKYFIGVFSRCGSSVSLHVLLNHIPFLKWFPIDHSKEVPLLQFFFVCLSDSGGFRGVRVGVCVGGGGGGGARPLLKIHFHGQF